MGRDAPGTLVRDLTSPVADVRRGSLLVVPVGATEQHGPHLPLTTDTDIAQALAERLAAARASVVVAPAVAYGSSGEHQDFPGTLSIGSVATELVLVELGRSATSTWPAMLLLSTHGGNAVSVRRAVARLRAEGRQVHAWSPDWGGDAHAGHSETSVMLALDEERVDDATIAAAHGPQAPLSELLGPMRRGGVAAVSPSGVLGDARTAAPQAGEQLLNNALAALIAFVEERFALGAPQ